MAWQGLEEIVGEEPITVIRLKCDRIRFNTGSAVFLPEGLPILWAVLQWLKDNPNHRVLITSHTDTVDTEKANQTLSSERSRSVLLVLTQAQEEWADFIIEQRAKHSSTTKKKDVDTILEALSDYMQWPDCAPGKPKPIAAFKTRYEAAFNAKDTDPDTDEADRVFWMRVHNVYTYRLHKLFGIADDDETSYPPYLDRLKWVDEGWADVAGQDWRAIGCGERHPKIDRGPEKAEPENRRTEFLFFEEGKQPKKDAANNAAGPNGEPPAWLESVYTKGRFKELECPCTQYYKRCLPQGNICFLIDISSSMTGQRMQEAKRQLVGALQDVDPDDKIAIVAFAHDAYTVWWDGASREVDFPITSPDGTFKEGNTFKTEKRQNVDLAKGGRPRLELATKTKVKEAIAWVNGLGMQGATNTSLGFNMAVHTVGFLEDKPDQPKNARTIEFLSDGCPNKRTGHATYPAEQAAVVSEVKAWNTYGWVINVTIFYPAVKAKKRPEDYVGLETFGQNLTKLSNPPGAYLKLDFQE